RVSDLSSGRSDVLVPGRQLKLNKTNREIVIENANIDEVMAWKNGYFMFDNQRITSIMKSISRWYDVEVEYNGFNNSERFGGTFSRSSNLADILRNLSGLGHVHFKIDKRKIVVTN
ncbi:MAG: FecR family protein, partial [Mucilaginibacter sp.]